MKNRFITAALSFVAVACSGGYEFADMYEGLPFEMPRVERPSIPSRSACLSEFGGVPDGVTLNSEAFEKAINSLSEAGGGHLIVPEGLWLTGPITLRSGVDLHLEKNAVILFKPDFDLYPIIDANFEGLDTRRHTSPINARGQKNISITGNGIIEGNGQYWRELIRKNVAPRVWDRHIETMGGVTTDERWYPSQGYIDGRTASKTLNVPEYTLDENRIVPFYRPVMVNLVDCENVLLEGCTYQNSPCWNIHPLWCKNLIIKDVTVRAPDYSVNGDGFDIDGCENVLVTGCTLDVGDDGICIKSGKNEDGRRHAKPCHNMIIKNCTVYHGHGGFVIGSEMSGGAWNIKVSDCSFLGTDTGLRFKTTRGRGGVIRDIWADNINMTDIVRHAVIFNLYYAGRSAKTAGQGQSDEVKEDIMPVDETTPEVRDIHFSNINCTGSEVTLFINGLPELPVSGLTFENCSIRGESGADINHARNLSFRNVTFPGVKGEQFSTNDVEGMTIL